jgi:hypothetical protein
MNNVVERVPQFNAIYKAPIFLWANTSELKLFTKFGGQDVSFTFHPMVSVQRLDQDLIKARVEMLKEFLDAPDDTKAKKNIASKIGPVLDEQKEVVAESASVKPNHVDEDDKKYRENSTQELLDKTKKKQEIVEILD